MTGVTEAEFMALLPHFEQALVASIQDRTIDGQPRASRCYSIEFISMYGILCLR